MNIMCLRALHLVPITFLNIFPILYDFVCQGDKRLLVRECLFFFSLSGNFLYVTLIVMIMAGQDGEACLSVSVTGSLIVLETTAVPFLLSEGLQSARPKPAPSILPAHTLVLGDSVFEQPLVSQ